MTTALHADAEIASQPQIWRQVADFAPSVFGKLPQKGERVAVVGCGSSWFMSMAYASLREAAGHGETDVYAGSEFNYDRKYDRVVSISRSGTTSEIVEFLGKIKTPSVVLTAIHNSPVEDRATETIIMDFADEQSVLQTRWATAALGLLRAHLGFDLNSIVKDAEAALASDISDLVEVEQISFLGRGWTIGLAHEAALKTRESSQFWAEAYPALDYRHGPLSISQPGRAVWAFGDIPADLVRDIKSTGALFESSTLDPMAHLIRAQRVAIAIAKKRGVDADNPRGLARSIILDK
ncbi:sugar isomerase [Candidatus Planktophila dulcis]|uniref:SIS domain-containing protein n=1 Tax=Candidatus Planktophila dulcis TaxID=1884914 RepID=UPI000BACBB04|nr:sugar isomerase [Candidatus Planktophila dulcis]ASY15165.1 sugar isomerase [Candidatus Planktophila dulcis]